MAERRMFTQKIVDSDAFLDMPLSTQALYFHLNMRADDDGFVNNSKKIQRMIGASEDDLKLLIVKRFVLAFENGVIVIKHWRMHNLLRKDRYNPTQYKAQKASLLLKDNGAYTEIEAPIPVDSLPDTQSATAWQPNGNQMATQDSIVKYRLGKESIDDDISIENPSPQRTAKPIRHKYGEYKNVLLSDEDFTKLKSEFPTDYQDRIERLSNYMASTGKSYKNHLATIRNWARKDKPTTNENPKEESGTPQGYKQNNTWDL